jgi:hypothetical protein
VNGTDFCLPRAAAEYSIQTVIREYLAFKDIQGQGSSWRDALKWGADHMH